MTNLSKVYFWDDRALYVGMDFTTEMHSHHAIQIVVGLGGKINIRTEHERLECDVAFIPADTLHQLGPNCTRIAALYLDNETSDAICLKRDLLIDGEIRQFPHHPFSKTIHDLFKVGEDQVDCIHVFDIFERLVESVLTSARPARVLDNRIQEVLEILKTQSETSISVSRLARSMGMSLSRLGHLFKDQTGFPIRRYFLWRKLINAVRWMENTTSLTEAAHQAGFSDSSHMNRTFKRMFGIKPSFFSNYSQFVQVINCSAYYG